MPEEEEEIEIATDDEMLVVIVPLFAGVLYPVVRNLYVNANRRAADM